MQTLPPLVALRAFEATARLQSVSRAAAELHVTHGAISRHVRSLEQVLGAALFVKRGRGLALTDTGERLRVAASEAFALLGDTWATLTCPGGQAPLVLSCSGSLLARWVIPRLARLERDLPGLRLHLSASERPPEADLAGMDAALLLAQPPWPSDWNVYELGIERIGPVFSPRLPGAERLLASGPDALLDQPLLHTRSRPQAWPEWAQTQRLDPAQLQFGTEFEHLVYLLEAAVAALGVAIAPYPLVSADLASGRLLAPWGFTETRARWVLCGARRNPDSRIGQLANWLGRELDDRQSSIAPSRTR